MKNTRSNRLRPILAGKLLFLFSLMLLFTIPQTASAHCDSYDGPVIKDALKAFDENKVDYVLKWVEEEHETEIKSLFSKTIRFKSADKEIYQILEKHFLETLVRLHREGEGEPYTGLKPAGSVEPIIALADKTLVEKDINDLASKVNAHVEKVIREKYAKAAELSKVKEE